MDDSAQKLSLPFLPLRDVVIFPHMVVPLFVGRTKSVNGLSSAMNLDKQIFLATQKSAAVDTPEEKDIYEMGTIGTVLQLLRLPDGTVKALVEGKRRGRMTRFVPKDNYYVAEVEAVPEDEPSQVEREALTRTVLGAFEEYSKINKNISKDVINNISGIEDLSQLADTIAAHFNFKLQDKQELLNTVKRTRGNRSDGFITQMAFNILHQGMGRLVTTGPLLLQGLHHDPVKVVCDCGFQSADCGFVSGL